MVCIVALLVQIYSVAYMADEVRYSSYAALVSLFTAAMLLVVVAGDLFVLLVGWEVMGICSYFLIGQYWERADARSAAVKASSSRDWATWVSSSASSFSAWLLGRSASMRSSRRRRRCHRSR